MSTMKPSTVSTRARYGTSYFPTREHAARYYKPYVKLESPRHWLSELSALIQRKLEAGEIHIGKPPVQPGQTLTIEDERYFVTEAPSDTTQGE